MKRCRCCNQEQGAFAFNLHRRMGDGLDLYCRDCRATKRKNYRQANLAKVRAGARKRAEQYVKRRGPYGKPRPYTYDPVKRRANNFVLRAIKSGLLVRPTICESCFSVGDIHAHHEDYSKPLEVQWLCPKCHGRHHRKPLMIETKAAKRHEDNQP